MLFRSAAHAVGNLEFDRAAVLLGEITREDPGMTDAWNQYAQVMVRLGRNAEALAAYKAMLTRQPASGSVLLDAAAIYLQIGQLDDARKHAEAAVGLEPVTAHQLLAKIALAARQPDVALREATAAEQADPTLPMADYVRGLLLHEQKKFGEALPFFQRASQRIAGRMVQLNDLHYYLGDCLAQEGRLEEAEQAFQKEVTLFPHLTRARNGLAMLYEASGRTDLTARTIEGMLAAMPTPGTYAKAADLWRVLGHPDRAADVTTRAAARFKGKK